MLTVIAAFLAVVTLFLWIGVWYVLKAFPVAPPMPHFPIRPTYAPRQMMFDLSVVPPLFYAASAWSSGRAIEQQMFFGTTDG